MSFRDLKLRGKLGVGFGVILLLMAAVSLISLITLNNLTAELDDVDRIWLQRVVVISELNDDISSLYINQLQHAFAVDPAKKAEYQEGMVRQIDEISTDIDSYQQLKETAEGRELYTEEEGALYARFEEKWDTYLGLTFEYLELFDEQQAPQAQALLTGEVREVFSDFRQDLEALVLLNQQGSAEAASRADVTFARTRRVIVLLFLLTVLISATLMAGLVRFITVPVRKLVDAVMKVAKGNLAVQIEAKTKDEIGTLGSAFNHMTNSLREAEAVLQTQNQELQKKSDQLEQQNEEIEHKNKELEATLDQLKETQQQLVVREKMASLGQLTAGIAHEIKNPLNFVNNFALLSSELTRELSEELHEHKDKKVKEVIEEVEELLEDLTFNARKIREHGQRADGIVRSMLQHSRGSTGEHEATEINGMVEEYLNLSYHGMRARMPDFNCTLEKDLDPAVGEVTLVPQDVGRVLINLLNNAFYATYEKSRDADDAYAPTVTVTTRRQQEQVVIEVRDNGNGIPEALQEKIFEPFFTTKPTGSGTGLGLSLSYEIITQGHHGRMAVESKPGEGATFTITLPGN